MTSLFDFTAVDEAGRVSLVVEVKSKTGTDDRWARELHGLIADRSSAFDSSAFLIVTPDRLYAWSPCAPPESVFDVDATDVLRSYLARADIGSDQRIEARTFEDVVGWWLQDLSTGVTAPPAIPGFEPIAAAVRDGRLVAERAA